MYKTPTSNFRIFVLAFGIFISNFPVFAHPEAVLLTQETSSKNISSLIEYRYRGQQFAGCSPDHIDGLEDLEWHQIPTEVLRVQKNTFWKLA